MSFVVIQSLSKYILPQILLMDSTHLHRLLKPTLPDIVIKAQNPDALLDLCVAPIGNCCSAWVVQLGKLLYVFAVATQDAASRHDAI